MVGSSSEAAAQNEQPEQQQQSGAASSSSGGQQHNAEAAAAQENGVEEQHDDQGDEQEPSTASILAMLGKRTDKLQTGLDTLRAQRDDLTKRKKEFNKELKNSKRRKSRLAAKAKEMTNEDLLDVINMRLAKDKQD